jgi:hypothetical protein
VPILFVVPGQGLPASTQDQGTQACLPGRLEQLYANDTLVDYALLTPKVWITQPSLDRRGVVFHTRRNCNNIRHAAIVPFRCCLVCEEEKDIKGWTAADRSLEPPAPLTYFYGGDFELSRLEPVD